MSLVVCLALLLSVLVGARSVLLATIARLSAFVCSRRDRMGNGKGRPQTSPFVVVVASCAALLNMCVSVHLCLCVSVSMFSEFYACPFYVHKFGQAALYYVCASVGS